MSSRWADDEKDKEARRREKEEKKSAKLIKQRLQQQQQQELEIQEAAASNERPAKRRRLSTDARVIDGQSAAVTEDATVTILRFDGGTWGPARHIASFEQLNHIEEGSYGSVSRAREIETGEIVAFKKLKIEADADEGFPVTAMREIQILKAARHRHVVELREVAIGPGPSDVYMVMEFLEHDLKTLQEDMSEPFLPSEIKTLMLQIVSGVEYLHDNWIIHRDLKTSNILMSNRGEIKLADFGMAREFSDPPPPNLTQLVVTLWYRAPELLLGSARYDNAIDVWSIGCILGELVRKEPLLTGKNEADQLSKIFSLVGTPNDKDWPSYRRLPNAKGLRFSSTTKTTEGTLNTHFPLLTAAGITLLAALLSLNPDSRPTASEVLKYPYFTEPPRPKTTAMFPTFPSKAGGERRKKLASPDAPQRGAAPKISSIEFSGLFEAKDRETVGAGFALR